MNALAAFPWPRPSSASSDPTWNGSSFTLGDSTTRLLAFTDASSHWSDSLTTLHEVEAGRDHPMDLASREMAVASMKKMGRPNAIILDVGCSSGFVLEDLQAALPRAGLIGADYLRGPLDSLSARMPAVPILQFDLRECPLPSACIDGITCLNVLEHIDDDRAALAEMHRILKPGGVAHVEVPAGPHLYDIYDEQLMHHRRYRLPELIGLAADLGFLVENSTHLGFFIYPAFVWAKRVNRRKADLPLIEKQRQVAAQIRSTRSSRFLRLLLRMEAKLGQLVSYPCGIRCVVVLRKR